MGTSPHKSDVKNALQRLLEYKEFKRSERLSDFLTYIVNETLEGRGDKIKGYTIGIEVFEKPEDFDPATDASVRVEAARLRKALEMYYLDTGRDEEVIIDLKKGSYKPVFRVTEEKSPALKQKKINSENEISQGSKKRLTIHLSILFIMALLCIGLYWLEYKHDKKSFSTVNVIPRVAVLPFYSVGDGKTESLKMHFLDSLLEKLNRFGEIDAINTESVKDIRFWEHRGAELKNVIDADYFLEGTFRHIDATTNITFRLLSAQTQTYIWAKKIFLPEMSEPLAYERQLNNITAQIVSEIASPYGVIQNSERERLKHIKTLQARDTYCILDYYAYASRKSKEGHHDVRTCLERIVQRKPDHSDAYAALSWVYGDELRFGYNRLAGEDSSDIRKKSFMAAKKAVEADPKNPHAHQFMALAAQLNDSPELTRHHAEVSLSLNPYDSEIVADAAWSFCQIGEWEKCIKHAKNSMVLNPQHPDWYHMAPFVYYYHTQDYDNALVHALQYYQPDFLWANLIVAATYANLGHAEKAREIATHINTRFPAFKENSSSALYAWNLNETFLQEVLEGARLAGVEF